MDYTFALRSDGQTPTQIIAPAETAAGVAAVLATLKPEVLVLPEPLLKDDSAASAGIRAREGDFKIRTSPAFDALAPAEAAAQHTLQFLFNPQRAARLVEFMRGIREPEPRRGSGHRHRGHVEDSPRNGLLVGNQPSR